MEAKAKFSGYPQVKCRGRVEALGIRIESGRPEVLPVRCLLENQVYVLKVAQMHIISVLSSKISVMKHLVVLLNLRKFFE